ncbi:MAG: dihydroorotate dehydrogenase (quinone) [Kiritimatiellia bacterium]
MLYSLFRSIAFKFNPSSPITRAWWLATALKLTHRRDRPHLLADRVPDHPVTVMGLHFRNPVGLPPPGSTRTATTSTRSARSASGSSSSAPSPQRPQPGNPSPAFRIIEREGSLRMGFNNKGVDLVQQVMRARYEGVIGINIGKNADTPIENAADDYLKGLRAAYDQADYIAINISSPNTRNLRTLQEGDSLARLLEALRREQDHLAAAKGRRVPLALKLAPDLNDEQLADAARLLLEYRFDGVIATNTTLSREGIEGCKHANEGGGLSGAPVREKSTRVIRALHGLLNGRIPIIGAGGIFSGADAQEKMQAGASLVQVYTGFIYRGPGIVADILKSMG